MTPENSTDFEGLVSSVAPSPYYALFNQQKKGWNAMEMKREMTRESVLKNNKKKTELEMEKGIDIPIVECVERLSLDWVGLALRNGFLSIFFFFCA